MIVTLDGVCVVVVVVFLCASHLFATLASQFEKHFDRMKAVRAVNGGNQLRSGCRLNAYNGFPFVCESVENGHSLILLTTLNNDAIDVQCDFFFFPSTKKRFALD